MTMQPAISPEAIPEYEQLLTMLPGVLHARIKLGENGLISEIHVLSGLSRSPKQLVRDIQSALEARYGLEIDHRAVSIAQIDAGPQDLGTPRQFRMVCKQVLSSMSGGTAYVQVTLALGETEYVGEASGATDFYARRLTVARATLEAVHAFLGQKVFSAVDVKSGTVADRETVIVAVDFQHGARGELLLGAVCSDHGDFNQSIVKATLDAINRRLCLLAVNN